MDKQVYTNSNVLAPTFDLAQAANWTAREIAGALGYWVIPNQSLAEGIDADRHGFTSHGAISGAVSEDRLKEALKSATLEMIKDMESLIDRESYIAFSELHPPKRFTNHATGYAGNVIVRIAIWEGDAHGLHLAVQVSARSNRNGD